MSGDLERALRQLLDSWEARAREAREKARTERTGDVQAAYYHRGAMDTYLRAVQDVRELLATGDEQAAPLPAAPAHYLPVSTEEASALLTRAGIYARSLSVHADHAFTAVFSRLQPVSQETRLRQLAEADARIVVLDHGKLSDTGEPFIDFAFRA